MQVKDTKTPKIQSQICVVIFIRYIPKNTVYFTSRRYPQYDILEHYASYAVKRPFPPAFSNESEARDGSRFVFMETVPYI